MPGFRDLHPDFQAAAKRACTPAQLEVLMLHEGGLGYQQIAFYRRVAKTTVRDMYRRAVQNIAHELCWSDGEVREALREAWREAA